MFAAIQAVVALRKLRFDLFARRFETWDATNDAIEALRDVCRKLRIGTPEDSDGGEARRQFIRLRRQLRLLFPPEVDACCERIQLAFQEYATLGMMMERPAAPSDQTAKVYIAQFGEYTQALDKTYRLQTELLILATPYMKQYGWLEIYGTPFARGVDGYVRAFIDKKFLPLRHRQPPEQP
ncbi:hypothetical protein MKK69_22100 [Methylobacterium sp. J-026]|uniref:hypothetical protein n=1 Tax=Methylobacterium sp. J-026 TaxID=2836624 RepID=UPI001FB8B5BC|nr:hypothetical protein [Methylobacterium sp. J-026]MCJ2136707.1 hypothetical protein [Methylobacterium sp. J-026]